MKIPWGSPTVIKLRLLMVAVMIFLLAVLFWPSHTIFEFPIQSGQEAAITYLGKDFEYNLFVHSVDASAGTAELSVFIPARSAYPAPDSGSYAYSTEQNWAVTLKDFKEGETYDFKGGNYNGPLFKLEQADETQMLLSVMDSWTGDDAYNQGMQYSENETDQIAPLSVITDKAKYTQGETVNISITNNTGSDIEMCSTLYRIGRLNYSDDLIEWRQLILDNTGYSANETFIIHAGETIGASWNQTEQVWSSDWSSTNASQVAPGQYKIETIPLTGNYSSGGIGYIDRCYSRPAEFPLDKCDYSVIIEIE
jgi:hypothetical protein